jgi:hypothetical protein
VYRAYSITSLTRQFLVYTVVLFFLQWWFKPRLAALPVTAALLLLEWASLRFAIRHAAAAEYDFIEVASRIRQQEQEWEGAARRRTIDVKGAQASD